jgi:amino acid adenylation domain-containing protein
VIVPDLAKRHEPFPLSDVQGAYWLGRAYTFELGGTSCHYYGEFERTGLDVARLAKAWDALIERHEMLRAVIGEDATQRILRDTPAWTMPIIDLRGLSREAADARVAAVRDELSHQLFDSSKWPLFDIRVHVLDGGVTRIHFSFDLLILDVFSFVLILAEWRRIYDGEALPPLSLSFRDYQVWEAAQHDTASYQRSLDHWRTRIQTMPPPPDLPLAKSPREVQHPRFTRRQMVLSNERWARLVARARQAGVTPAMIVCAAYAQVLERWSKSKAFTLNLTLFNRRPVHAEVNQVVGDFTSLVLLEVDHTARASLVDRAKALQDRLRADLAHNQVSAIRVLREWSRVRGRPVTAPVIFTSAIGLTDAAQNEADDADAWLGEVVHSVSQTPQVWLDHQVYERRGRLLLFWDSVDELFPAGMLDEMFEAYGQLLERMSDGDEVVWSTWPLELVPARALAPRLAANATAAPVPPGLLHSSLEVQAGLRPSAPAVITSKRTLTYAELERDASRIAAKLRASGVTRGDRVAIVMEKSTEQVAAVLGVLGAGAAYVPIAATQPDDRIRYIVENTTARAVLTDVALTSRAAWPDGVAVLGVSPEPFAELPAGHLAVDQAQTDLAYIIYTSGSTGRPKGVMIDHRGALNTCVDVDTRYRVTPGDRLFGISDLGFDLSVWDIFGTIAAGATLVLPDEAGTRDPSHWLELMAAHDVSVWSSVPALMMMLVEYLRGAEGAKMPESLRLVMMSGDWIPLEAPTELWRLRPGVEVMSLGGATEASIWSNDFPITHVDPSWKSVPYGKPLANQSFHVLDQHGLDAPTWVPGQLYIGGIGVALGYYGDPEKTASKFVAHPRTGERLYFTGDLGRYFPDGNLEFLGREDLQVKIHGHRIELGEIESVLREHPMIREAVVFPHEVRAGDRQLVGYVVLADTESAAEKPSVEALREHLAKKLPSHMVPRFFVFLERLPLSSNGKVDRKALPAPDLGARKKKAPKNELERRIHAVWARSLPAAEIGVDESFFDLGGDSQLAVRLMLELREALGREVPIRALFEAPTIEGIAIKLGGVTEVSGAPVVLSDHELYAHYARRGIGQRLAALGTDKSYVRARGMRAWMRDEHGNDLEVLDMVGGYGSTILGHNHPELVALSKELLEREEPFHVQYTNNVAVGRLCKAISDRLEAATGTPFVITLASTGAEVIEAALKHAKMEYRARAYMVDKASENVAAVIIDQERKGHAKVAPTLFDEASSRLGRAVTTLTELYAAIVATNDAMWDEEPIFIALEHAFHGLTTGAMSLTASKDFSEAFRWVGVRGEFIPQRPEALEALVERERRAVLSLGFDAAGHVVLKERPWHKVAGLLLEPVQGEGGIRPLDRGFVGTVRTVADRAEFPVIVDEIQCGMGRTGTFTAAEGIGLRGDYYTFSKSLGGGLSKVAAMAVTERRYQAEFGYLHGSTFAEDGISANLALKTLEILDRDRLIDAAAAKGRIFKAKLEELKARHPSVIKDVRGQGLMLGIQIATQESSPSMVLRVVSQSDPEMFNQIIAGFLLNEKRLRIAPTKTRSTIRFLPNAYVTEAEMDRAIAAFDSVCELLEKVNVGRLLRHLVVPEGDPSDPIADWRARYPAFRDDEPLPGEPRVAHIAHVEDDETLLTAEPSMAEIPADRRDALLWRLFKFTRPAIGQRLRLVTATGQAVHVSFLGLVITASIFEQMMKSEDRQLVIDKIQEAVDLAARSGCEVVGFGGYTSIVTLNCTAVATPRIALTSGNAFTVVLAVEGAKEAAKARGLDLSQCTAAIVGGAGNIGSVAAKVMAGLCKKVVLVGRDKADPRMRRVANQIFCNAEDALLVDREAPGVAASIRDTAPVQALLAAGKPMGGGNLLSALEAEGHGAQPWVTITDDLGALADCDVIISATSSSGDVILPAHLSEKVQIICDVATPKDVSASVKTAWPHIRVLSGGLARLPGDQGVQLTGTHLPANHIYGCVGETALLGVEGHRAHFSFGDISTEQVEHIRRLAEKYGFVVGTVDRNS